MYNQFQPQYFQNPPIRTEIIHVNGENGARALNMYPNSNALLLDDSAPLIWLAQTDGAGYKTVTPYEIKPYNPKPQADTELEARLKRLEEIIYAKSNNGTAQPAERDAAEPYADEKR